MARSSAYDQWEDAGLAFTDTEVADFNVQALAERHLLWLCGVVRIVARREQLPNMPKPKFNQTMLKMLKARATWLCVAAGIETVDLVAVCTLPDPKSKEGKELTQEALNAEPEEFLNTIKARLVALMTNFVTLSRRAAGPQKWKKQEHSRSNKVANAIAGDIRTVEQLLETLTTLPD